MTLNPEMETAHRLITMTRKSLFLTGKAGTGKTTFLRRLRTESPKRMVVLAPTGIAAINAGGSTLHSFFQLPFAPYIPDAVYSKEKYNFNRTKLKIIRSLELLVIDEVSMVRADVMDSVDATLRHCRRSALPFGGLQLLLIGDLSQLSPVVQENEWRLLSPYYPTPYFFSSRALQRVSYATIELQHIYRQRDPDFVALLNSIREHRADPTTLARLNTRYIPDFQPRREDGYIRLVTHNRQADLINHEELQKIDAPAYTFRATIQGNFPAYSYPTDADLTLKAGAQVMFVKNDLKKRYFNGSIGHISQINARGFRVRLPRNPQDTDSAEAIEVEVERDLWQNVRYSLNAQTGELEEVVDGTFEQMPVRPAWAITVHKSQGLTFSRAIIDVAHAFAHGQTYVALSRLKSLDGLVLSAPIPPEAIIGDPAVDAFTRQAGAANPSEAEIAALELEAALATIRELYDFTRLRALMTRLHHLLSESFAASKYPKVHQSLSAAEAALQADLVEVAQRFAAEYTRLLRANPRIAENEALQQRLRKASHYFAGRLSGMTDACDAVRKVLKASANKEVVRRMGELLQDIREEVQQRETLLDYVAEQGLLPESYYRIRAKVQAGIALTQAERSSHAGAQRERDGEETGGETKTPAPTKEKVQPAQLPHPELFEQIRAWRTRQAKREEVAPFRILHQKTLLNILEALPETLEELQTISGIGPYILNRYGEDLVAIIREYLHEKGEA